MTKAEQIQLSTWRFRVLQRTDERSRNVARSWQARDEPAAGQSEASPAHEALSFRPRQNRCLFAALSRPPEVQNLADDLTYETIRQWCRTFGRAYARRLRQRRGRLGDTWHLDGLFVTIIGRQQYLWRAG